MFVKLMLLVLVVLENVAAGVDLYCFLIWEVPLIGFIVHSIYITESILNVY